MRVAAGAALALALVAAAAAAQAGPEGSRRGPRQSYANPSAVIAADLALSRNAREEGQWQALREAAAPDAVMFAPRMVDAAAWLRSRREPGQPGRWLPQIVWMSCDGDYAVSRGSWTQGTDAGEYITIWERQKKGDWKWLVHDKGERETPGADTEMIAGNVAECAGLPRRGPRPKDSPPLVPHDATSYDRSLRWSVQVAADCSRTVMVEAWDGRALVPVITVRRGPPAAGCD